MLDQEIKEKIIEHANEFPDKEVCGFLVETKVGLKVVRSKNDSMHPETHFVINGADYLLASKLGKIKAIYHSQNENQPSLLDKLNAEQHSYYSIIYSKKTGEFIEYSTKIEL